METVVDVSPVDPAQVLEHLGRADCLKSSGGTVTAAEICRAGTTFKVQAEGKTIAAYNLQMAWHDNARVAWVMAAGGHNPRIDITATVTPAIEAQARAWGATEVALNTRRPGLIRKMKKQGFVVTSVTMRKKIQ